MLEINLDFNAVLDRDRLRRSFACENSDVILEAPPAFAPRRGCVR